MTRVLQLIKGLGRGGAEQLVVSAVRYADRDAFDCEVAYLLPHKDALVPELEELQVPVHCLEGAGNLSWVPRLRDLIRSRGVDLVHAHSPYPAAFVRLSVSPGLPIVYTEHNVWDRYRPATRWANMATFARNNWVFAVSDQVRASIAYPRGFRALRRPPSETLYHGPDPGALAEVCPDGVRAELGIPPDVPVVGTVANFKGHKGIPHLLRAARVVADRIPGIRFVLVGTGPLERQRREEASRLGLDGTAIFTGFRGDAIRMASAFDVFVLPSLKEGLSIALLEAMALGKPVVVTNAGGLPEVVSDGVEGLVVPPANPAALAQAILRLVGDDDLRGRCGDAARLRASAFDVRRAVHRIESVYRELTG